MAPKVDLPAMRRAIVAEAAALAFEADGETARPVSNAESARFDDLIKTEKLLTKVEAMPERRIAAPMPLDAGPPGAENRTIPAVAARTYSGFPGPNSAQRAHEFGLVLAQLAHQPWAQSRGMTEGINTAGGFLVPLQQAGDVLRLVEEYAIAPRYFDVRVMTAEELKVPLRGTGITSYYVSEAGAGTESQLVLSQVGLVSRKLMTLSKCSTELAEDSVADVANLIVEEMASSISQKIDEAAFLGDGSATYSGITGLGPAFTNMKGVDEGQGIRVGTGDLPSELTLGDFTGTMAYLPAYQGATDIAWYCHPVTYANMMRVMVAAGGNEIKGLEAGAGPSRQFLGFPVRLVNALQTGTAVSQPLAYFGDLRQAAIYGDRRAFRWGSSDSALNAFEEDQMVLRATHRYDVNVHSIGSASAAGPVVMLIGKAS